MRASTRPGIWAALLLTCGILVGAAPRAEALLGCVQGLSPSAFVKCIKAKVDDLIGIKNTVLEYLDDIRKGRWKDLVGKVVRKIGGPVIEVVQAALGGDWPKLLGVAAPLMPPPLDVIARELSSRETWHLIREVVVGLQRRDAVRIFRAVATRLGVEPLAINIAAIVVGGGSWKDKLSKVLKAFERELSGLVSELKRQIQRTTHDLLLPLIKRAGAMVEKMVLSPAIGLVKDALAREADQLAQSIVPALGVPSTSVQAGLALEMLANKRAADAVRRVGREKAVLEAFEKELPSRMLKAGRGLLADRLTALLSEQLGAWTLPLWTWAETGVSAIRNSLQTLAGSVPIAGGILSGAVGVAIDLAWKMLSLRIRKLVSSGVRDVVLLALSAGDVLGRAGASRGPSLRDGQALCGLASRVLKRAAADTSMANPVARPASGTAPKTKRTSASEILERPAAVEVTELNAAMQEKLSLSKFTQQLRGVLAPVRAAVNRLVASLLRRDRALLDQVGRLAGASQ